MSGGARPSGEQWTIRYGEQEAVVVQVGGGLRTYRSAGRDVLHGYAESARADAGRGQVLMPWPNRIRDGRYTFAGIDRQLSLTEVARRNASHGLVRWAQWSLSQHDSDAVVVEHTLRPQPGWDWTLHLQVAYTLSDDGLMVTPSATNLSDTAAPFGYGAHPYLTAGEDQVDQLRLTVPGKRTITVDDRLIPIGSAAVADSPYDFRAGRPIGDARLDHCYAKLDGEGEGEGEGEGAGAGRWSVEVAHGDRRTSLWADAERFPFAQVFTGDSLSASSARRTGVAVEPMTCPSNAFESGEGLLTLQPGQTWTATWGVAGSLS